MEALGTVVSGVKEFYKSTNKANLSGAIDVVVVEQVSNQPPLCVWCHFRKSLASNLVRPLVAECRAPLAWVREVFWGSFVALHVWGRGWGDGVGVGGARQQRVEVLMMSFSIINILHNLVLR